MIDLDELLNRPSAWLTVEKESDIVVSSRIRLARNLRAFRFPGWGGEEACSRVWAALKPILTDVKAMPECLSMEMNDINQLDKMVLFERHLISRELSEKGKGSGLVVALDEQMSIMVNEEDHLRIQVINPGLELIEAWERIDTLDSEIEARVDYAYDPRLGYLTACPSNVGTGMRASVMVHVPALVLLEEINPIVKGLGKIGLAVRGLGGEGSDASGNMFQISNQITLGEEEMQVVGNLHEIVREIVEHEKNARKRLMQKKGIMVRDHVGRAYGILSNAHILSSKDALDMISGLRLGVDLGLLPGLTPPVLDELTLLIRPGHLQKIETKRLKMRERDVSRAKLVRSKLADIAK
ncbi:MAG: protein arginine kinase [Verrucomicrobiota bacterium]|jgi:protein arginine kinase